jgi:hypothetical protein
MLCTQHVRAIILLVPSTLTLIPKPKPFLCTQDDNAINKATN